MADPLAYFITFRCYGTWLHGDDRGSVVRRSSSSPSEALLPDPRLAEAERSLRRGPETQLSQRGRQVAAQAIREVCDHRGWALLALNVRTNHVHSVVHAQGVSPERVMTDLKSYATRRLREAKLASANERLWARHGSTIYLWTGEEVERTCYYVEYEQ